MLEKMEPENHALQTRHSGWLGQLSLDLLVAKGAPKSAQWVKVDSPRTTFDYPSQNTRKACPDLATP